LVDVTVNAVLVTCIDAGVIVDFDNDVFTVDFFYIHAVEAFSDDAASFQCDFTQPRRHITLLVALGSAPDHSRFAAEFGSMLPFAFRNHVFADVEDIVTQDADAPIERGRSELLDGEHIGFFEEAFCYVTEVGFAGGFLHVAAEAGIGCFYNDGFAQRVKDFSDFFVVQILFIEKYSWDAWDVVFFEKRVLMDFIGADFDGFRVVDDLFAQFPSCFRHDVGREQGVGGCADEDSVVVGDVFYVFSE